MLGSVPSEAMGLINLALLKIYFYYYNDINPTT